VEIANLTAENARLKSENATLRAEKDSAMTAANAKIEAVTNEWANKILGEWMTQNTNLLKDYEELKALTAKPDKTDDEKQRMTALVSAPRSAIEAPTLAQFKEIVTAAFNSIPKPPAPTAVVPDTSSNPTTTTSGSGKKSDENLNKTKTSEELAADSARELEEQRLAKEAKLKEIAPLNDTIRSEESRSVPQADPQTSEGKALKAAMPTEWQSALSGATIDAMAKRVSWLTQRISNAGGQEKDQLDALESAFRGAGWLHDPSSKKTHHAGPVTARGELQQLITDRRAALAARTNSPADSSGTK
jgi:hypothetical protein